MILQQFSTQDFQRETEAAGGDWRRAVGIFILTWAATQDPEKAILRLRALKGLVSFTFRVKHLRPVVEFVCGPMPAMR
jgi:hypothetical protein